LLKSQETADESLDLSFLSLVEAVLPEEEVFTTSSSTKVSISLTTIVIFGGFQIKNKSDCCGETFA
jgi:hypothetical protein